MLLLYFRNMRLVLRLVCLRTRRKSYCHASALNVTLPQNTQEILHVVFRAIRWVGIAVPIMEIRNQGFLLYNLSYNN
jgi:hypothetical protein